MNAHQPTKKPLITPEEQARRQHAIDFARGSVRFEGLIPSAEGERINQDFICGKLTMHEALAAVEALGSCESSQFPGHDSTMKSQP